MANAKAVAVAVEDPIFRTIGFGEVVISLIPTGAKDPNARLFAKFRDSYLDKPTPEIIKLLALKHEQYENKDVPVRSRGFVTQETYDAYVTPDKTYFKYKDKMVHAKDVNAGLEIAEKNGWVPTDKNYIFIKKPTIQKSSIYGN